jgi:hypothetical protein
MHEMAELLSNAPSGNATTSTPLFDSDTKATHVYMVNAQHMV